MVRSAVPCALALLLVGFAPATVRAGGVSLESIKTGWTRADDAAREEMAKTVESTPTWESIVAAREAARAQGEVAAEAKKLRDRLAETPKDDEKASDAKDRDRDRAALADLEKGADRDRVGLARLAAAAAVALAGLPEAQGPKAVQVLLRDGAREEREEPATWSVETVGHARRERMPGVLLDVIADAARAFKKTEADRAGFARKAEEINKKVADAVDEYLRGRQAAGDFSGRTPVDLTAHLEVARREAERFLTKAQKEVEAADRERRNATAALALSVAGSPAAAQNDALDLVEHRLVADSDVENRALGYRVLGEVQALRAFQRLKQGLSDADPRGVVAALGGFGRRTENEAVGVVAPFLSDERWQVRAAAAASLAELGRAACVKPLVEALPGAKGRDLDDLRAALMALSGKSFPAAAGPWATWWDAEGKTFVGPRDPGGARRGAGGAVPRGGEPLPDAGAVSFYGIETHSSRVLFVLDVSGSMNWPGSEHDAGKKKVDVLRSEMRKTLAGLPDGSIFDVILFANGVKVWRKEPQVRGAKTFVDAVEFVEKAEVLGATNIHDALEAAFRLMGMGITTDREKEPVFDTVFFMTDGRPTVGKVVDPKLILGQVRRWNESRKVRIHVVGLGGKDKENADPKARDDLDEGFLRELAKENGGQCVIR